MDVDQMLMLMIYIVIKCQDPEMFAHFKLANMFATSSIKQSKLGYCAMNLCACIEQVIVLEKSDILEPGVAIDQIVEEESKEPHQNKVEVTNNEKVKEKEEEEERFSKVDEEEELKDIVFSETLDDRFAHLFKNPVPLQEENQS